MDIIALMDAAFEKGASDLHLSVGRRPVLRVGGRLVEIGDKKLEPADTEQMAKRIAPPRNWDHVKDRLADITRSRECLGYQPSVEIEDGIVATVEWIKTKLAT